METALTAEQREAIRKKQREYKREWRKKNPGKDAEYMKRYWLRKAGETTETRPTEKRGVPS